MAGTRWIIVLVAATLYAAAVTAADTLETQVREFALDRVQDGRRLLEGPRLVPTPAVPAELDCVALYERRVALQRELDDYQPAYWDDPRNQAAVFLGAVWTPAFYFLGYSALDARLDAIDHVGPRAEIDALSRVSARRRCFER